MSSDTSAITLLLVEDHELTRQGIAFGLKQHEKLKIIGEAEDGQEAIDLTAKENPKVILMDIALPVINGIDATRQIKHDFPETKIIMLTSHSDKEKVFGAFSAGADGYCMKDIKIDRLVQVIDMVMDGGVWLDPGIAGYILKVMPKIAGMEENKTVQEQDKLFKSLTPRELEILTFIADGKNNKEISEALTLSLYTVKNHVSNVIQKLAVEDRTQAAVLAHKRGLFQSDD